MVLGPGGAARLQEPLGAQEGTGECWVGRVAEPPGEDKAVLRYSDGGTVKRQQGTDRKLLDMPAAHPFQ